MFLLLLNQINSINMKRIRKISVDLTEENYINLKTFCALHGLKMKEVINECLHGLLNKQEEKKIPELALWDQKGS